MKDAIVHNYIQNTINITAGTVNITGQKDFVIEAGVLKKYQGEAVDVVVGKCFNNWEGCLWRPENKKRNYSKWCYRNRGARICTLHCINFYYDPGYCYDNWH